MESFEKIIDGNGERILVPVGSKPAYKANSIIKKSNKKSFSLSVPDFNKSIVPGQILILLAGPYAGSRVVFLKKSTSNRLIVTGPYSINKVPLRSVHQAYVIATSTKIDFSSIKVPEKLTEELLNSNKIKQIYDSKEAEFFREDKKVSEVNPELFKIQEEINQKITSAVKKLEFLEEYLKTKFTLTDNDKPHIMKF